MSTLLERYRSIDSEIKELEALKKELREQIGTLKEGITTIDEDYYIEVVPNRRFDARLAKSLLSDEEYAKILKTAPDSTLARSVLSPQDYEVLMAVNGQKWTIRERKD